MTEFRTLEVKALFNSDEFIDFRDACKRNHVSRSGKLRELANKFSAQTNRSNESKNVCSRASAPRIRDLANQVSARLNHRRNVRGSEWPSHGQNMAMSLPGRANVGHRMRV